MVQASLKMYRMFILSYLLLVFFSFTWVYAGMCQIICFITNLKSAVGIKVFSHQTGMICLCFVKVFDAFVFCIYLYIFTLLAFFPEMIATEDEMRSAKIPVDNRDYCAHKLLQYWSCRKDHFPFVVQCEHEKHSYLNCQYEE